MSHKCITHVISADEFSKILEQKDSVIVKFTATWCGPCKIIAPKYAELSQSSLDIFFVEIDVDDLDDSDMLKDHKISGIPAFVLFRKGKEVGRVVGVCEKYLENLVNTL